MLVHVQALTDVSAATVFPLRAINPDRDMGRIRASALGDRLRQLRVDEGLTLRAASAAVGIGDNRICDWENGVAEPKLSTLARYGMLFGLTVAQLLHGVM